MPLPIVFVTHFLAGCTGFIGILAVSCAALIVDMNANPKLLTIRLVLFWVCAQVGEALGGAIAGDVVASWGLPAAGCVGTGQ